MAANGNATGMALSASSSSSPSTLSTNKASKPPSNGKAVVENPRKQNASPVEPQNKKQAAPTTKAWQGHNPITSRITTTTTTTSPLTNGLDIAAQKSASKASTEPHTDKHAHDRLLFLLANMTGCDATITLKNGEQFTGVLSGGTFDSAAKSFYTLQMTKRVRSHQQMNGNTELPDEYIGSGEDHTTSFDVQDIIDLAVNNVAISMKTTQNGNAASSFRTDTEISGRAPTAPRERELQRWEPGPAGMSLDDMAIEESGTNGWDQFAVNEQKYGVKTSYQEDIYTTSIDMSHPQYKKRLAEAERMAREIEGTTASNAHVAEERRKDISGIDDVDEEDKYSGVRRDAPSLSKGSSGSYVPPSRRPITGQATVPGAPFDPAIISSQVARSKDTAEEPASRSSTIEKTPSPIPAAKISPSTTEDRVRDTADAFKQFASSEKLRMRQAQEAKHTRARHEKNVKLNDLKKFAENFKLKSRVPDDLVPILAKDHEKQAEIKRKAEEAARDEELRDKDRSKADSPASTSTTPQASDRLSTSSQSSKPRVSQSRSQFVPQLTPGMSQRQAGVFGVKPGTRPAAPQVKSNVEAPSGPASQNNAVPVSPSAAANRLNVNAKAFEFRPAAHNFMPSGTSPSPQRLPSVAPPPPAAQSSFFDEKEKAVIAQRGSGTEEDDLNVIAYLRQIALAYPDEQKKGLVALGGVPQPFKTNPTWTVPANRQNSTYEDMFPKPHMGRSPLHTPNGQMPHAHQLPTNMQPGTMPQGQRFFAPQHGMPHPFAFDPRMSGGPGASVQSSPRFQQAQVPFSAQMGQMPQMAHIPQFNGQPMPMYSMSPNMGHRPLHMPQGAPVMPQSFMHGPGTPMRTPYGQYQQMMIPQGPAGYGGHQGYSPMPQHAGPHMQHMPMQAGSSASPRQAPHMMQHGNSHQGFQPHQMMFAPGQQGPYAMNQRQMSSGHYAQATPRQQQALPAGQPLPSPGVGPPLTQTTSDERK